MLHYVKIVEMPKLHDHNEDVPYFEHHNLTDITTPVKVDVLYIY